VINGKPPGVSSGLSGGATITRLQKRHVPSFPSHAEHTRRKGIFVEELVKGARVDHSVRVGAVGSEPTRIMSELSDGTEVVVPG
jgi:hypothetical protein